MKLLFALATCTLFADFQSDLENLRMRVETLECNVTPARNPRAETGTGLFFYGEPLYWRISEEGLEYAITAPFTLSIDTETVGGVSVTAFYAFDVGNANTHEPDFKWDWGFRVGMGYDFCRDGWDLTSAWTSFRHELDNTLTTPDDPNPNNLTSGGSGFFISPFWTAKIFAPPGLVNEADVHWKVHINLIDLELGRKFLIGRFLSLRPFIGLRNGWIQQNYNLLFIAPNININTSIPPSGTGNGRQIAILMKNNFWGIGTRAGLDTEWFLGKGFSIFGNAAFAFLTGHFHTRYKLYDQRPVFEQTAIAVGAIRLTNTTPAFNDSFKSANRIKTDVPMADLNLGIQWEKAFCSGKYYFSIWGGYEQNIFFTQNRFMNYQNDFTLVSFSTASPLGGSGAEGPNFFTDRGNMVGSGFSGGMELGF